MVYHRREGIRLKSPFSNLHTEGFSPDQVPFLGLTMEDSRDLAVLTED